MRSMTCPHILRMLEGPFSLYAAHIVWLFSGVGYMAGKLLFLLAAITMESLCHIERSSVHDSVMLLYERVNFIS